MGESGNRDRRDEQSEDVRQLLEMIRIEAQLDALFAGEVQQHPEPFEELRTAVASVEHDSPSADVNYSEQQRLWSHCQVNSGESADECDRDANFDLRDVQVDVRKQNSPPRRGKNPSALKKRRGVRAARGEVEEIYCESSGEEIIASEEVNPSDGGLMSEIDEYLVMTSRPLQLGRRSRRIRKLQ